MDSSRLGGLDGQYAWVPASGLARKFTIQHCFHAFSRWKAGLATSPNRLDGNLVGVVKQDPSTGEISISDTDIVKQPQRPNSTRLGTPGRTDSLSHCSVVALRSRKIDRFMRTLLGSVAGSVNAPQITPTSRNRPYLVLKIAENEFAFYNVYWNSFLVVESPDSVIPFQPKMHLGREAVSDEHILSRIPEGAVFIVKSEGSDGSAISLYSKKFHTFVTMTDDGKVNASATSPGDSELFRIVLLMKVDLFAE
jgi:hypothetical protein